MKANTVDLVEIFGNQVRYVVPLYQRPYVWNRDDQWEPLWQDVQAVADRQLDDTPSNDSIPHFLGAVVLEQALVPSGKINSRSIIDGQQRLTTLQLLLAAARSVAADQGLEDSRKTIEKLLLNESFLVKHDGFEFKVMPTERDQAAFSEALRGSLAALTGTHRIHEAYRYFRDAIRDWATDAGDGQTVERHVDALVTVLWSRLVVVTIDLDPGDNAQIIFETLNARGTPLLAGDLIKNHLFQVATTQGAAIDVLYRDHWRKLDTDWWRAEVRQGRLMRPRLDAYLTHWLAMRTGAEVVSHDLFPAFKRYLAGGGLTAEAVLMDIERYATVYETFEREPSHTDLGCFLYRLGAMDVTTAYPALLWLLGPDGIAEPGEQKAALAAIESWLVRRLLTRGTTKAYNTVFLALLNALRTQGAAAPAGAPAVISYLTGLEGESRAWPSDGEVLESLRSLPLYTTLVRSRVRMVLEALEEGLYTGFSEKVILPHDLTIEHVLPQEWSANWPFPEGADTILAKTRRDSIKHMLGNLTLVTGRLNPKMSNAPWQEKREALREHSVMRISKDIVDADAWDESAIAQRGERLAELAVRIWARPQMGAEGASPEPMPSATHGTEPVVTPSSVVADGDAFDAPLSIATAVGVAGELRRIIATSRELGLHPRADKYCVMVTPPSDRRVMLFTVWPQGDDGGSFRIWTSPEAFAHSFNGIGLEQARVVLGGSDAAGTLRASDVAPFLDAIAGLVGAKAPSTPTDVAQERPGVAGTVPEAVEEVIDHRAGPWISPLARQFAEDAAARDGVILRPNSSKNGQPWYFQVRHPRFRQVVAYAHPRQDELRIDYRLPSESDTYGVAKSQDNFYGVSLRVKEPGDLAIASQLLTDALARDG